MRWPDFFLAGAPKSGTTSLYHWLRESPDVFMPELKEPRFFLESIDRSTFFLPCVTDEADYLALFESAGPNQRIGEATPLYMMDPTAPARIAARCPHAQLVFVLRDPVERARSAYHFHETRRATGRSLAEAIDRAERAHGISDLRVSYLLEPGFYARHLAAWDRHFDRDRILVLLFEELVADEPAAVAVVSRFLEVRCPELSPLDAARKNVALKPRGRLAGRLLRSRGLRAAAGAVLPRTLAKRIGERTLMRPFEKPRMQPDDRRRLESLYRSDVDGLESRLGRELPWFHRRRALGAAS